MASESGAFCLLELRVFSAFLNILRLICSGPGYPTQRAGTTSCPRSERFWLLELRALGASRGVAPFSGHGYPGRRTTSTAAPTIHRGRAQLRRPGVCRGGGDRRPGLAAVPRSPHCLRSPRERPPIFFRRGSPWLQPWGGAAARRMLNERNNLDNRVIPGMIAVAGTGLRQGGRPRWREQALCKRPAVSRATSPKTLASQRGRNGFAGAVRDRVDKDGSVSGGL